MKITLIDLLLLRFGVFTPKFYKLLQREYNLHIPTLKEMVEVVD